MGSYGGEFVNVFEFLRSSTPVLGTELTALTASRFRTLWLSPIQSDSVVTLYFARRDFFLDGSEGPIVVPRGVTLSFGPAGVLHLMANTMLVIEGEVEALPFRIFTLDGEGASRAVVRIESELMEEVRPEWWGARPLRNASESARTRARPVGASWGWRRVSARQDVSSSGELGWSSDTSNTRVQMTFDPALCIVGSQFPTGVEVFFGAAQSAIFGTASRDDASPFIRFREVLRGIQMPTSVFGRGHAITEVFFAALLLLALIGCDRTPSSPVDAGVSTDTVDAPKVADDIVVSRPDVVRADRGEPDIAVSDVAEDAPADASLTDALDASPDVNTDADGVLLTDLGPAQQMRAACPEPTDGDPTIPAPRLVFPLSPMRATSRRPTLIWELAQGLTGARIEICRDRCCRTVIATLDAAGTSVRPTEMLPPGVVFWRARGRRGEQVGRATSFTWEFGVRHRDSAADTAFGSIYDFNGDGYDDFVVHARLPYPEGDDFLIYRGGPAWPRADQFQRVRVPAGSVQPGNGDFDGDGLADLYMHVSHDGIRGQERCRAYASTPGGVGPTYRDVLCGPSWPAIGDYNGDGYSDAVSLQVQPMPQPLFYANSFQVVYGGPSGHGSGGRSELGDPAGPRRPNLTTAFASPGDVNGDGYADVILADYSIHGGNGRAWIYWGSAFGIRPSDPQEIRSPVLDQAVEFGAYAMAAGDLNLDRRGDFVVAEGSRAVMRVFLGAERSVVLADSVERPDPILPRISGEPSGGLFWGYQGTVGYGLFYNAVPTLVVGCSRCVEDADAGVRTGVGRVYLFRWRLSEGVVDSAGVLRSENGEGRVFGPSTAPARDLNGDGYDDLIIGDFGIEPGDGLVRIVPGGPIGPAWPDRRFISAPPSMSSGPYYPFGSSLSEVHRVVSTVGA